MALTGQQLLDYACGQFENGAYDAALEAFILAYTKGYEKEWVLENIYNCYMEGNKAEFQKTYEHWNTGMKPLYENLTLDFIPYREGEYYVFDKELRSFKGIFSAEILRNVTRQEEFRQAEFSALAMAMGWDWSDLPEILAEAEFRKIYVVCQDMNRCASFFKISELAGYAKKIMLFPDMEAFQHYFHEHASEYLPKLCVGTEEGKKRLLDIINQEHTYRLTPEGRNTDNVLLTIGIPTANRGNLLLKRLENLLQMPYDAEIEIAVSKNCNKLYEEEYTKASRIGDARLHYFDHGRELCCVNNWHYVVEMSRGKYVMLTSDEDDIIPGALEHYLKLLNDNPALSMVRPGSTAQYIFTAEREYGKKGWDAFEITFLRQSHFPGMIVNRKNFIEADLLKLDKYWDKNLYYTYYTHEWWCNALSQKGDCMMEPVTLYDDSHPVDVVEEARKVGRSEIPGWKPYQSRIGQYLGMIDYLTTIIKVDDEERLYGFMERAIGKVAWFFELGRRTGFDSEHYMEMLDKYVQTVIETVDQSGLSEEHKLRLLQFLMTCCEYCYIADKEMKEQEVSVQVVEKVN